MKPETIAREEIKTRKQQEKKIREGKRKRL